MNEQILEILVILQEECAEAVVSVSKCIRFGPDQVMNKDDEITNIQRLQNELGDIQALVELLVDENVGVTKEGIEEAKLRKFEKLKTWSDLKINK